MLNANTLKWLYREALQLIRILTEAEQEACITVEDLFRTFWNRLDTSIMKPYYASNAANLADNVKKLQRSG